MIATPDLIASLAQDLTPIRRLRPPVARAVFWLLLAAVVLFALAVGLGVRPDLAQRLSEPAFAFCIGASLLTGVLAAIAAFLVSLPDRTRYWLLLPVPALMAWLSAVGYQCVARWTSLGPNGIGAAEAVRCCATVVLTSLPLSISLLFMLRYAATMRPLAVAFAGCIAISAFTSTALALLIAVNASVFLLIGNIGAAVLFVGLGGAFGRRLFHWVRPRTVLPRH